MSTEAASPGAETRDRAASLTADARAFHRAVTHLVRAYQAMDRRDICCYDVSVSQCWALEAISDDGPLALNQVASRLLLDKSTASRVVDALERKGYVRRRKHPEDGRTLQLEATAAGRRLRAKIEADVLARDEKVLEGLDPEVRRSVTRVVDELAGAAARGASPSGGSCCPPR